MLRSYASNASDRAAEDREIDVAHEAAGFIRGGAVLAGEPDQPGDLVHCCGGDAGSGECLGGPACAALLVVRGSGVVHRVVKPERHLDACPASPGPRPASSSCARQSARWRTLVVASRRLRPGGEQRVGERGRIPRRTQPAEQSGRTARAGRVTAGGTSSPAAGGGPATRPRRRASVPSVQARGPGAPASGPACRGAAWCGASGGLGRRRAGLEHLRGRPPRR